MMADVVDHSFSARLDCHYLVLAPDSVDERTPLVIALHGFGSNPDIMLPLTAKLFADSAVVVSVQGPNQFFRGTSTRDVGYGWITSRRPAESIRLHHDMVLHVIAETSRHFGIPPERRLLVGFSQPVALNYRFAATHPDAVRGVIAICGGLPGDWDDGAYQRVNASVLHISRTDDEYYPPSVTEHYSERLRRRAADVEFHLIEGKHQMPSRGSDIVGPWLRRVLESARAAW
jgi:phospholipase/carboxylesterase